ncbi:hypothetical protein KI387_042572, partial [Taxus chinensis]
AEMSLAAVKEGDGVVEEEDSVVKRSKAMALTPIVVPESQHYEVINDPCLVKTDVILACDEFRVERMHDEQEGEEKGMVGTPCPNRHDDSKLVGLFQTAVTKEQIDGGINKEQSQFCHHPKKDLQRTYEDDIMEDCIHERRVPLEYILSVVPNSKILSHKNVMGSPWYEDISVFAN